MSTISGDLEIRLRRLVCRLKMLLWVQLEASLYSILMRVPPDYPCCKCLYLVAILVLVDYGAHGTLVTPFVCRSHIDLICPGPRLPANPSSPRLVENGQIARVGFII